MLWVMEVPLSVVWFPGLKLAACTGVKSFGVYEIHPREIVIASRLEQGEDHVSYGIVSGYDDQKSRTTE